MRDISELPCASTIGPRAAETSYSNVGSCSAGVVLPSPYAVEGTTLIGHGPARGGETHLWRRVECRSPVGSVVQVGMKGVCTAELRDDDVFAVWFDEGVAGTMLHWVTMKYSEKWHFTVLNEVVDARLLAEAERWAERVRKG